MVSLGDAVDRWALPALSDYQRDSLSLTGCTARETVELTEPVYHFQVALFITNSLFRTWLHPSVGPALRKIRDTIFSELSLSAKPSHPVYISRLDASARRMTNEAALCDRLATAGTTVLTASTVPFREQARILSQASLVVGPHGSGLTNMLYSPDAVPVLELRPINCTGRSPFWDQSYRSVAAVTGHPYGALFFENAPEQDNWTVDIDFVVEAIRRLSSAGTHSGGPPALADGNRSDEGRSDGETRLPQAGATIDPPLPGRGDGDLNGN